MGAFLCGDSMQVYVVHGSPLSGKSTYVRDHKGNNDIVYDYDLIMSALSGRDIHDHNDNLQSYVLDIRDLIIAKLKSEDKIDNAWIITTRVTDSLKQSLTGLNAKYVDCKIDIDTAKRRLRDNPGGRDITKWGAAIDSYFAATRDWTSFYKSPEWQHKRKTILKRDGYSCRECARYGKTESANTVHHVMPLSDRPDLKLDSRNLISLSDYDHERMHNRLTGGLSKLGSEWAERIAKRYPELAKCKASPQI